MIDARRYLSLLCFGVLASCSRGSATASRLTSGADVTAVSVHADGSRSVVCKSGAHLHNVSDDDLYADGLCQQSPKMVQWPRDIPGYDQLPSRLIMDVASKGGTWYVATTAGLSISSDRGHTWTTKTQKDGLVGDSVIKIAVSGERLYVATYRGLSFSDDQAKTFTTLDTAHIIAVAVRGNEILELDATDSGPSLWLSKDAGANWVELSNALLAKAGDVELPDASANYVVNTPAGIVVSADQGATWKLTRPSTGGFLAKYRDKLYAGMADHLAYSQDQGLTWTELPPVMVDGVKATGIVSVAATSDGIIISDSGATELSISKDQGSTWTRIHAADRVGPRAASQLFSAADDVAGPLVATCDGLVVSPDHGATWAVQRPATLPYMEPRSTGLVVDSGVAGSFLYFFGYLNKLLAISTDGGKTFTTFNKIGDTAAVDIAHVRLLDGVLYAGSSSGLHVSKDFGATWTVITKGSGGFPSNTVADVAKSGQNLVALTDKGFAVSSDGGATWTAKAASISAGTLIAANGRVFVSDYSLFLASDDLNSVKKLDAAAGIGSTAPGFYSLAYGNGTYMTAASTGWGAPAPVYLSKDGATWQEVPGGTYYMRDLQIRDDAFFLMQSTILYSGPIGSAASYVWDFSDQYLTSLTLDANSVFVTTAGGCLYIQN